MGFSRKRGRPKTQQAKKDYGTPQLRAKKNLGITTEPLDLCLSKKLISTEEHEAGIRLRWLYTLRFGSPDISAYRFEPPSSSMHRDDNSEWRKERNLEYDNALNELEKYNAKRIIMNICIFNQRHSFMLPYNAGTTLLEMKKRKNQFAKFKDGTDILVKILGKKK